MRQEAWRKAHDESDFYAGLFSRMKRDLPRANRPIAGHSRGRCHVRGDIRKLYQWGKFRGRECKPFTFRIHLANGTPAGTRHVAAFRKGTVRNECGSTLLL